MLKNRINIDLNEIAKFFIKAFLFTFLFQIQSLLYKAEFFSGVFNPFSAVFLNISEVFLIIAIIVYGLAQLKNPNNFSPEQEFVSTRLYLALGGLFAFSVTILFSVLMASDKVISFMYFLKCLELTGFVMLVFRGLISRDEIIKVFSLAVGIQLLIGFVQFLLQRDLGLTILGESRIGPDVLNVAKLNLAGEKIVRAYGTLAHANIFGGVVFVAMALAIQKLNRQLLPIKLAWIFFLAIGLLISFSRSAWLAIIVYLLVIAAQQSVKIHWKKFILAMVSMIFVLVVFNLHQLIINRIIDFSWQAWEERGLFSETALAILKDNWWGIGAQNFVLEMPKYAVHSLSPWLYQPVHNVFLLALVEFGIQGLLALLVFLISIVSVLFEAMRRLLKSERYFWSNYFAMLAGLLLLGSFDHYLLTSFQGMVLVAIIMALLLRDALDRRIAVKSLDK
ncbi:O-antigen ligase family protein [Candidatus Peregrinibacteria bacterium]|nr:O-antigen ligase family protein [Candidatus Peregrinibacteria bacterium]